MKNVLIFCYTKLILNGFKQKYKNELTMLGWINGSKLVHRHCLSKGTNKQECWLIITKPLPVANHNIIITPYLVQQMCQISRQEGYEKLDTFILIWLYKGLMIDFDVFDAVLFNFVLFLNPENIMFTF